MRAVWKRAVWKFTLAPSPGSFEVQMPVGAEVLTCQWQGSAFGFGVQLWALVDPDAPKVARRFVILPTGAPFVGESDKYVGMVEAPTGLILHVFDAGPA